MRTVRLIRDSLPACKKTRPYKETQASLEVQLALLVLKMHEEVSEIGKAMDDPTEYADLLTAMQELARRNGVGWVTVLLAQDEKAEMKGGFTKGKVMYRHGKNECIPVKDGLSPDEHYDG